MRKLIVMVALVASACGFNTPGDGEKVGQIVRVNTHGIFCKTNDAQIIRGGLNGGSGITGGGAFEFTIADDSTAKVFETLMREQKEVIIKYHTSGFYTECSTGSGGEFLTGFESAKKDSTKP